MAPRNSTRDRLVLVLLLRRGRVGDDNAESMPKSRSFSGMVAYFDSFCGGVNSTGRARPRLEKRKPHMAKAKSKLWTGRS